MRWDRLFEDLEAQLAAERRLELDAEIVEGTRRERAQVQLIDRFAATRDRPVRLQILGAGPVSGVLADLGADWLLIAQGTRTALVPVGAILSVSGLAASSDENRGRGRRFGLGIALRAIARDRSAVAVHDLGGGLSVGTIDRVGADHFDLTEHPADALRRTESVTGHRTIAFTGIAVVRRT